MGGLKNGVAKKMVLGGTLFKSCKCSSSFLKTYFFSESVSFDHEIMDLTNFRLVLGICIVHVVIWQNFVFQ